MLRGGLRTRDGRIIAAIMGLSVIIIGGFVFAEYSKNQQFLKQAVIAENYLRTGNYEQSINAYEEALSVMDSDEELLTIGLAEAYIGIGDYEKALEVLRSCYQKTSGTKVKEKIEEVISEKTDYEYTQSISRAEVYVNNGAYDKAIDILEDAKQIKRKDVTAYQKIAETYLRMGEYELAKEEALEGLEITGEDSMEITLEITESYITRERYDQLRTKASDYILQENYDEGFSYYKEAIALLPEQSEAYEELAQIYIECEAYDEAETLLSQACELTKSEELIQLLSDTIELRELEDQIEDTMSVLFEALQRGNTTAVTAIMDTTFFAEKIAAKTPVYYNLNEEDERSGFGLVIYDSQSIYCGDIREGYKEGNGIYFILSRGSFGTGYYYFDGEWKSDLPNGDGETMEMTICSDESGKTYISKIRTEGKYKDAVENGRMTKTFYIQGEVTKRLCYNAKDGKPLPMLTENAQALPTPQADSYVIGILSLEEEQAKEYYSVEAQTIWGVKPFIED